MKIRINKLLSVFIATMIMVMNSSLCCFANNPTDNFNVQAVLLNTFPQEKVNKKFKPIYVTIINNNSEPVLLTVDTETYYYNGPKKEKFPDFEYILKKSKKNEKIRAWSTMPVAVLGGTVLAVGSFGLLCFAPAILCVGSVLYTQGAEYHNNAIVKTIFVENGLPIRFEPKQKVESVLLMPRKMNVDEIEITNLSLIDGQKFNKKVKVNINE